MTAEYGSILTLLTDFGARDPYVGILKGVVAQVNPFLRVIDLTHEIPPQDVGAARFALMNSYLYFPPGTVHLAIVDPGVGSRRRAVAIAARTTPEQSPSLFVGPDNGLFSGVLSGVLSRTLPLAAVELTNPHCWRTPQPSSTFHGRDIFATVAAHLASGVELEQVGTPIEIDSLVSLPGFGYHIEHGPQPDSYRVHGVIQAIDHFGNLITNIPAAAVKQVQWWLTIGSTDVASKTTYADGQPNEVLALIGSHDWIEIAVNCGNAQTILGVGRGDPVSVVAQRLDR